MSGFFFFFLSFVFEVHFFFHALTHNSLLLCCQPALPCTSNMVSSTWKGKHHYWMARSCKSWQAQRKAGNFPFCVVLAPFHPQLWWARLKELHVCPANDFLIYLNLGGKCHVKLEHNIHYTVGLLLLFFNNVVHVRMKPFMLELAR